eukprot:Skav230545  [mRNA]  locus=scaffold1365:47438:49491:+ [translate_table: standard]
MLCERVSKTGSVLFLENRTDLSVSVAPYGTPPEGFMELPPRSEPQPIPLDWFGQSTLWVGVTEELKAGLEQ